MTTFYYALADQSQVILQIYNAYGQQMDIMINETQQRGNHQVTWNAEGMPAGIYYYRLSTNDYRLTTCGKMVVER